MGGQRWWAFALLVARLQFILQFNLIYVWSSWQINIIFIFFVGPPVSVMRCCWDQLSWQWGVSVWTVAGQPAEPSHDAQQQGRRLHQLHPQSCRVQELRRGEGTIQTYNTCLMLRSHSYWLSSPFCLQWYNERVDNFMSCVANRTIKPVLELNIWECYSSDAHCSTIVLL